MAVAPTGCLCCRGQGSPWAPEEQGGCVEESGGLRAPWAEVGLEEGSVEWAVQPWVTAMSARAAVRLQATPGASEEPAGRARSRRRWPFGRSGKGA